MISFPNAKINLGLNIVEKRPDGYHNLETIFYPICLEDALEIVAPTNAQEECELHTTGIALEGNTENNLVVKAYRLLQKEYSLPPIRIYLHKNIPSGAGLGGGSSDASFMLKMLNKRFDLRLSDTKLEEYAGRLGADCAFFIRNKPVFATGIGTIFHPIELSLNGFHLVLVKPDIFVSTRDAFAQMMPTRPAQSLPEIIKAPIEEWRERGMVNDFERTVFARHPQIKEIKEELHRQGAVYAAMSGSGSSVFGLFNAPPTFSKQLFADSLVSFLPLR